MARHFLRIKKTHNGINQGYDGSKDKTFKGFCDNCKQTKL